MKKKEEVIESHVIVTPLEDIMSDRFGRYSKYIIQDRALPDARDGLKPVQRRILYAMYEDGNTYDKPYRKSAKTVGNVIANYHPHGDSSVYEAMVRMSQDWKITNPLIDMQGNNGSIDDDPAAAMRYTEARLSKIADFMLVDIDKDTVLWAPNFDDEKMEPTVLPSRYPNLLVNGITGIAAGYATNIPPHNLGEVLDAAVYRIQHPRCSLDELMQFVQGPDFPTGGIVQGIDGIRQAFESGKGRVVVRSKVEIEQTRSLQQLIVHEIPYEVVKSALVKKIDDIRLNKKLEGILDVRDESDRNGLRIVIDIKKDAPAETILNYLYKNTDLQISYNYNVIAIVNKCPVQLGLAGMLDAFIAHRQDVVLRRSRFELDKKEKRCHVLEGLIKAVSILDEIIAIIRSSKDKADSKTRIMEAFDFSEPQAEAIVTMRLYRLSNTDITQLKEEYMQLVNEIEDLNEILSDPKRLRRVMIDELREVKKTFVTPRRTQIESQIEEIVIDQKQMIPSEQVMCTISRDGYAKRVSLRSYNASSEAISGCKDGDVLIGYREVNTLDTLLFFTETGTYGYLPIYELEDAKWKDMGAHISSRIRITSQEKILSACVLSRFDTAGYILTLTKRGMIKRTAIRDYASSRTSKTMTNIKLEEGDSVIACLFAQEEDEILIASQSGYVTRYPITLVPQTSTRSKGVRAMNLSEEEVAAACIHHQDNAQLLIISDQCAMKRVKLTDIPVLGRPTRGVRVCKRLKSKPYVIAHIRTYQLNDSFTLIGEENAYLTMKDIALMSCDSTFSNPLRHTENFRFYEPLARIEYEPELQKTDREEVMELSDDFEEDYIDGQMSLFDE